jgi:hypothetical protein
LRGEVVDFVRLHLLDDTNQAGTVSQVAMVKEKAHVFFVAITIKMIYAIGIKKGWCGA